MVRGDDEVAHTADRREFEADEREALADARETVLDAREVLINARDEVGEEREDEAHTILVDAAERDARADARDASADERELTASRDAFVSANAEYGATQKARRAAALDWAEAKHDRDSSATDRAELAEEDRTPPLPSRGSLRAPRTASGSGRPDVTR